MEKFKCIFYSLTIAILLSSCTLFTEENDEKYTPYIINKDGSVKYYASDKYFGIAFDWNLNDKEVDSILTSYNLVAERKIWENTWSVYSKEGKRAHEFFTTYKRPRKTLGDSSFVEFALPRIKNKLALETDDYAHLFNDYSIRSYSDSSSLDIINQIKNNEYIIDLWYSSFNYYRYAGYLLNEEGLSPKELWEIIIYSKDSLQIDLNIAYDIESLGNDDQLSTNQWHLKKAGIEKAWDITKGNPAIKLAVIDNSIDTRHPEFGGSIIAKANLTTSGTPDDPLGDANQSHHGTATLGLIAAQHNNGIGLKGTSPNLSFIAIKGLFKQNGNTVISANNIFNSFDFAAISGAAVINNSYTIYGSIFEDFSSVENAIEQLISTGRNGKGAAVVFGSGNDGIITKVGFDDFSVPNNTINVGATTATDFRWGYSTGNKYVHISAPSGDVNNNGDVVTLDGLGTLGINSSDYNTGFGGTSAAAPLVAGTIGLMLSVNPDLTLAQIESILAATADKVGNYNYNANSRPGHSYELGYGRLNAYKAVKESIQNVFIDKNYTSSQSITNATLLNGVQNQMASSVTITVAHGQALLINGTLTAPNNSSSVIDLFGNLLIEENAILNKSKIIVHNGAKVVIRNATSLNGTRIEVQSGGELTIDDDAQTTFDPSVLFNNYGTFRVGKGAIVNVKIKHIMLLPILL